MAIEIERKFLVRNDGWRDQVTSSRRITQGYLANDEGYNSIRVRIDGDRANLNLKSGRTTITRHEFEYTIPVSDAKEILETLVRGAMIDKTRHIIHHRDHEWEVDEFHGANDGLVVAEVELSGEDQYFEKPDWVGEEVSHDSRYYNVNLINHPYCDWQK